MPSLFQRGIAAFLVMRASKLTAVSRETITWFKIWMSFKYLALKGHCFKATGFQPVEPDPPQTRVLKGRRINRNG